MNIKNIFSYISGLLLIGSTISCSTIGSIDTTTIINTITNTIANVNAVEVITNKPLCDIIKISPSLDTAPISIGVGGLRTSIDVDKYLIPHIVIEGGSTFYIGYLNIEDKNWILDTYKTMEKFNSSNYGNCHLEVDRVNDCLWINGFGWDPSFDFQTILIKNCHKNNTPSIMKKYKIAKLEGGGSSWDKTLEQFILCSHSFNWLALEYSKDSIIKEVLRGGYGAESGGEKEDFYISKADPVKHGDGITKNIWYYSTDNIMHNSLRGSNNKRQDKWVNATSNNYASGWDDMCYHSLKSDNVEPGTAYICAAFWGVDWGYSPNGIFMNIWKTDDLSNGNGHFEYDPNNLLLIDERGGAYKRYAPRLAEAKYGGVFVAYNRGGRVIIKWIPSDVKTNSSGIKEFDLGGGNISDICVDRDGNLHVVYVLSNTLVYRKVYFYEESDTRLLDIIDGVKDKISNI